LSPDGKRIVVAADFNAPVVVWDVAGGNEVWRHDPGVQMRVYSAHRPAFSADGRRVVGSRLDAIGVWDANNCELLLHCDGDRCDSFTLAADGKKVAAATVGGVIRQWDLSEKSEQIVAPGHWQSVGDIALSADGKIAATGSSFPIHLWETATGRLLGT